MKKNVIFRIAAIVLMCTLVTACFASSTFAKYTSKATLDNNKLTVAKWDIKYMNTENGTQLATTNAPTISVNLFDNVKDSDNGAENDVATAAGKTLIAPGTKGVVNFEGVKNDSEVTANVEIKVKSITDNGIPVVLKDKNGTTLIAGSTIYKGNVEMGQTLTTATIGDVTWEWVFEKGDSAEAKAANDNTDTGLGIAARSGAIEYIVEFEIIVNQVD